MSLMSAHKGIENRLDKLIAAVDRLTKAVEMAVEKKVIEKEVVRTSDPRICGASIGTHVCDLPVGHEHPRRHWDSRQPPGYQEFVP